MNDNWWDNLNLTNGKRKISSNLTIQSKSGNNLFVSYEIIITVQFNCNGHGQI